MELEEAIKLLKEMQDNCKNKHTYKDEKAEAKAEAIEVVLKELDKKDKEIERKTEHAKYFSKERNKKIVRIGALEKKLNDSIPKNKIREKIKELEIELKLWGDKYSRDSYGYHFTQVITEQQEKVLKQLLEEE